MKVYRVPEVWADVEGYKGIYRVSDQGRVASQKCELSVVSGKYVYLSKGGVVRRMKVAYLVARAFKQNAEGRPYVVHLNGDTSDNRAVNLQWSEKNEKSVSVLFGSYGSKSVLQYSKDGFFVGKYESLSDAEGKTGVSRQSISRVACGRGKTAGGFVWRYGN